MSLDAKITNKLPANNVKVEFSSKDKNVRSYCVPENQADKFITNYKKNDKKTSVIANTAFITSIIAGCFATSFVTKSIKNNVLKWILNTSGGIIGAIASIVGCSKYIESQHNKLLNQHNAKELQ